MSNSFGKAMILTLVGVGLVIVIGVASGKDAATGGYLIGFYSAPFIFSGIIVGIWAKRSKKLWSWLAYFWRFALGAVALLVVATVGEAGKRVSAVVTDPEKSHLVVNGTDVRHSDFGFAITLPAATFHLDDKLQEQANQFFEQRGSHSNYIWVLQDSLRTGVVMVMVSKAVLNGREALRAVARGMERGVGKAGMRTLEDTVIWSSQAHEFRFAVALPNGTYLKARCLPGTAFVVCVQTVTTNANTLDSVREGMRLES